MKYVHLMKMGTCLFPWKYSDWRTIFIFCFHFTWYFLKKCKKFEEIQSNQRHSGIHHTEFPLIGLIASLVNVTFQCTQKSMETRRWKKYSIRIAAIKSSFFVHFYLSSEKCSWQDKHTVRRGHGHGKKFALAKVNVLVVRFLMMFFYI